MTPLPPQIEIDHVYNIDCVDGKLTDTGAVIIKPSRKGVTKMRRKMKTYAG